MKCYVNNMCVIYKDRNIYHNNIYTKFILNSLQFKY